MSKCQTIAVAMAVLLYGCGGGSGSAPATPAAPPPANVAPTAEFSIPDDAHERAEYTLDASASSDSDGSISTWDWSLDLGNSGDVNVALVANGDSATLRIGELAEDASVTVTLTVTDNDGETGQLSRSIAVRELDVDLLPPVPADPERGLLGTDSDGDGVRDDIEIAIHELHPLSKDNREMLRYSASVLNQALAAGDSSDDRDDDDVSEGIAKMANCLVVHGDMDHLAESSVLRALAFDTQERLDAYEKFLVGRHGTSQRTVRVEPQDCKLPQNQGG